MQRFSKEEKLKIVEEYEQTGISLTSLQKKYKIDKNQIKHWIDQCRMYGKLIKPSHRYNSEFKLKLLNYQQKHRLSDYQTALMFGISSRSVVSSWRRLYIKGGSQALIPQQDKEFKMPKKSLIPNKPREEWTEQEELLYLRMENEYLKKLVALIQKEEEQIKPIKKKRSKSLKN